MNLECLDPSICFKNIEKLQPRNLIFVSGTLSPMDALEQETGIKFIKKFVNRHVIN